MKINAKTDYACKALLELSMHWPNNNPLQMNEIGKKHNIPSKFLTQILLTLKSLGLVISIRGKMGGYLLAKAPNEITLFNVFNGFESQSIEEKHNCNVLDEIYSKINKSVNSNLEQITFEEIVNRQKVSQNVVSFEI